MSPPLSRNEFEEMVRELFVDKGITATDLADQILGTICVHYALTGSSYKQWRDLCDLAWRIAHATETGDAPS